MIKVNIINRDELLCIINNSLKNNKNIDLSDCYIENIKLEEMDLSNTDFSWSNIKNVSFKNSILRNCKFENVLFVNTNFSYSNLRDSNFSGANLRKCNLSSSDVRGVNFFTSLLEGANLQNILTDENTLYFRLKCPESGYFIGYKKCFNQRMVTLLIPNDAKRSSATSNTCRCSKAKVLEISNLDKTEFYKEAYSYVETDFLYKLGEMSIANNYDNDRWADSTGGIHFYMTWEEASHYM